VEIFNHTLNGSWQLIKPDNRNIVSRTGLEMVKLQYSWTW